MDGTKWKVYEDNLYSYSKYHIANIIFVMVATMVSDTIIYLSNISAHSTDLYLVGNPFHVFTHIVTFIVLTCIMSSLVSVTDFIMPFNYGFLVFYM